MRVRHHSNARWYVLCHFVICYGCVLVVVPGGVMGACNHPPKVDMDISDASYTPILIIFLPVYVGGREITTLFSYLGITFHKHHHGQD